MNYSLKQALEVREKNKGLIGKIDSRGWLIIDIFAAPIEDKSFTEFLRIYAQTRNNVRSLMPFANQTMTVKVRLESVDCPFGNGYFNYSELSEALK